MCHALVRTNTTGQPFVGRCIKCGKENMAMREGGETCPKDNEVSDENALLTILEMDFSNK